MTQKEVFNLIEDLATKALLCNTAEKVEYLNKIKNISQIHSSGLAIDEAVINMLRKPLGAYIYYIESINNWNWRQDCSN